MTLNHCCPGCSLRSSSSSLNHYNNNCHHHHHHHHHYHHRHHQNSVQVLSHNLTATIRSCMNVHTSKHCNRHRASNLFFFFGASSRTRSSHAPGLLAALENLSDIPPRFPLFAQESCGTANRFIQAFRFFPASACHFEDRHPCSVLLPVYHHI